MARAFLLIWLASAILSARPLLVISIDGLDHRYLRDADKLGLKIPHLRKMVKEGAWADGGVIGVVPTVTFPSHTTIVTGVRPDQHGILNNNRPKEEGGERYFFASFLKVPTLWDAAKKAGLRVGAVHWPVTVDSKNVDWDFPEHFKRRLGPGMDWEATAEKATPGLIDKMVAMFPSMPQEWIDDRIRTMATLYILQNEKPDLVLLHLIDHDNEAHETGPFSMHATAVLEFHDELIGRILAAKPKNMAVALVSDHGFERIDKTVSPWEWLQEAGVSGSIDSSGVFLTVSEESVAAVMRKKGLREIPAAEWTRFVPQRAKPLAAFEPPEHVQFTRAATDKAGNLPKPHGDHGFWPLRYRSTYLLWGSGIKAQKLGEIDILSIAGRLASVLNIEFGKDNK
ncbi:MAG: ectonucleotide pyrophosphatase/phosphodiesterase [Bryobacteraceae bacterium]